MGYFSGTYNPNDERTNDEQVAAARWELLRRNSAFQNVARRWIESREFRLNHADTSEYHNQKIHHPRCALDWMLTPAERVEVIQAQLAKNRVFLDPRFNFGPIECKRLFSELETLKRKALGCFRVRPLRSHVLLRLDDTWRDAPRGFKYQFRLAVRGDSKFQALQRELQETGRFLSWAAHRLASKPSAEQIREITEHLCGLGSWCRELANFHRIFALPDTGYTPASLQLHFDKIRKSFETSRQFDARDKYGRTKSFLGTADHWKWFLAAEEKGLDWSKSKDLYQLAERYTDDLKPRPGKPNRANVKAYGGIDQPSKSTLVKNRRKTVAAHCRSIQQLIEKEYPPSAESGVL